MSNQTTTLADFPAFRVIAPIQNIDEAFPLVAGVTVRVMIRGQWRAFTPNTVVSFSLSYNEDPIAAHERAVARGHQTHWMNQDAVVMHNGPHGPQETVVGLELGQLVQLEGRLFRLAPTPNGNVDLRSTPRITSAPNTEDTDCATCGKLLDAGTVWVVDSDGWGNVTCSPDCADEEARALVDLNPDTDWT